LRPTYRHYSAVIVDVFYDHFLSKNWNVYHARPLPDYAADAYRIISDFTSLPEEARYMMPYMIDGNWLVNYAKLEGIGRALAGMARRTPFASKMEIAVHDLEAHYDDFKKEFDIFFPELQEKAKSFLLNYNSIV